MCFFSDADWLESKRTPGGQFTEWWGDCGQSVVRASETGAFIVGLRQWVNFSATTTQLALGKFWNIEWFRWEFCVCDIQHIWIYWSRRLNSCHYIPLYRAYWGTKGEGMRQNRGLKHEILWKQFLAWIWFTVFTSISYISVLGLSQGS